MHVMRGGMLGENLVASLADPMQRVSLDRENIRRVFEEAVAGAFGGGAAAA